MNRDFKGWTQDGVALQILRYRIGVFKGKKAWMAGVYGFLKVLKLLSVQIHGGGQYADYKVYTKRGYATLSIAWADECQHLNTGSLQAKEVILDSKTKDSKYKITTDWGALDAYHVQAVMVKMRSLQSQLNNGVLIPLSLPE